MSGVITEAVVSDDVLIDVSSFSLDDLLELASDEAFTTALNRVIATPGNCANSFQSSI